ncbi:MAG: hypothetical protein ORN54_11480 [Cyclobacteriaceae bacterium]|nr:hypothetical protein [Cyclobacteriaceae bacterium]
MKLPNYPLLLIIVLNLFQCTPRQKESAKSVEYTKGQFGYDLKFLRKYHSDLVLLGEDSTAAQLIVLPAYQGRVMTSTADGFGGASYGWVNHDLIASAKMQEHINVFGGEERFWLGPEGGQYSIFFKKGVPFTFDNWFVPKELDIESFTLLSATKTEAKFEKEMHLENYSGNTFDLKVNRNIRLLERDSVMALLKADLPKDVKVVAFESENILSNIGTKAWIKDTGLLSIWILSMLNASDSGVVAIPFKKGEERELGKIVTDTYFGKVPADRLKVKDGLMVFKADAGYRSKVGISPQRALPWVCSYDAANQVLTLAQFTLPTETKEYVNSLWEQQKEPYKGDAVNSYNDGPLEKGGQLGKFYEIESSSPAAALKPNESIKHIHRTIHIQGSKASLEKIVSKALSIKLSDISFN